MAKPDRIDLPLAGAIGQKVIRIELGSRVHLSDGTTLDFVASGRDRVNVYRMPKEDPHGQ